MKLKKELIIFLLGTNLISTTYIFYDFIRKNQKKENIEYCQKNEEQKKESFSIIDPLEEDTYFKRYYQICRDNEYDIDTRCIRSHTTLENILNTTYVLNTRAHYEVPEETPQNIKNDLKKTTNKNGLLIGQCSAFTWKDDKMLTADHCLGEAKPLRISWTQTINPKSKAAYFVEIDSNEYEVDVLKKVDDGIDAALIRLKKSPKKFPKITVADLSKMKPGQLVYQAGNMEGEGIQLKKGIVSRVKKPFVLTIFDQITLKNQNFRNRHFMLDLTIYSGDSGSPVYLIKDGEPHLAGIVTKRKERANLILRIDKIIKSLKLKKP